MAAEVKMNAFRSGLKWEGQGPAPRAPGEQQVGLSTQDPSEFPPSEEASRWDTQR